MYQSTGYVLKMLKFPPFLALSRLRNRYGVTSLREISYIQGFYSSEHFPRRGKATQHRGIIANDLGEGRGSSVGFLMKKRKGKRKGERIGGAVRT
jgi:hypothetical protein